MKRSRVLIPLAFAAVLGGHLAWSVRSTDVGPWMQISPEEVPSPWASYFADGAVWMGLSYGVAAAFAVFCLLRFHANRKRAVAGAAGGLTLVGVLSFAGCFLTGCCGSPMLPIYLSLFGPRFVGASKPLSFAITLASVAAGYFWVTRRKGGACTTPCCGGQTEMTLPTAGRTVHWITGWLETPAGKVAKVATRMRFADRLGAFKARVGINRMHYAVEPGLYAVGDPTSDSPVFVSANYKLSLDHLRGALPGRDGWILVLDTKGINVWCAAGKGTFGTEEIANRIAATRLAEVVAHRRLVLPQLGATGVAAHEVRRRTGFRVLYGPVRAKDLPAFLDAGMRATQEMRRVTFTLRERLVLIPMELVIGGKYALVFLAAMFLLSGLRREGYSLDQALRHGPGTIALCALGFLAGAALTPTLLPWLPGRSFSVKGALAGVLPALGYFAYGFNFRPAAGLGARLAIAAWLLILPAISAFFAMNFTGASNYTSLSGVKKEMRFALPAQIAGLIVGVGLWIIGRLIGPL